MNEMLGIFGVSAVIGSLVTLVVCVFRADARAERAAQRERDEATRRLILMLCEAVSPSRPVSSRPTQDEPQ